MNERMLLHMFCAALPRPASTTTPTKNNFLSMSIDWIIPHHRISTAQRHSHSHKQQHRQASDYRSTRKQVGSTKAQKWWDLTYLPVHELFVWVVGFS